MKATSLRLAQRGATTCLLAVATALIAASGAAAQGLPPAGEACDGDAANRVLLFGEGADPAVRDPGRTAVCEAAGAAGIAVDYSDDSSVFSAADLADYDAVIFLPTPATCSPTPSSRRSRPTCAAAAASPRSALPPRPSRAGRSGARWSAAASAR